MTDTEVLSAVVRAGCILLTADLLDVESADQQDRGSQRFPQQHDHKTSLERAVAHAAQQWLLDTGLAEELPHSAAVMLQVALG